MGSQIGSVSIIERRLTKRAGREAGELAGGMVSV
jgi:hypothetical protein